MHGPRGLRCNAAAPGPTIANIVAAWGSQLAEERPGQLMQATVPTPATAAQLAASITFLLSDDGTNINGAILASGGGWSALWGSGTRAGGRRRGGPPSSAAPGFTRTSVLLARGLKSAPRGSTYTRRALSRATSCTILWASASEQSPWSIGIRDTAWEWKYVVYEGSLITVSSIPHSCSSRCMYETVCAEKPC